MCDKEFVWNPSKCECECNKACDVGEYLDYENCKCLLGRVFVLFGAFSAFGVCKIFL